MPWLRTIQNQTVMQTTWLRFETKRESVLLYLLLHWSQWFTLASGQEGEERSSRIALL